MTAGAFRYSPYYLFVMVLRRCNRFFSFSFDCLHVLLLADWTTGATSDTRPAASTLYSTGQDSIRKEPRSQRSDLARQKKGRGVPGRRITSIYLAFLEWK